MRIRCAAWAGFALFLSSGLSWWLLSGAAPELDAPKRSQILLTNDDGVGAPGLKAILDELEKLGDVLVVAPARNWSGASQSLQIDDPVRVKLILREGRAEPLYAVEGPPATCVLLALEHLAKGRRIDLVVSGINRGENVGLDIPCSGTVGAARMAADLGIPALALSLAYGSKELPAAARASAKLVAEALERGLGAGVVLNVNFPRAPPAEWKPPVIARPGGRGFALTHEPKEKAGAVAGADLVFEPRLALEKGPFPEGSDARALAEGHVTATVLGSGVPAGQDSWWLSGWSFFR